MEKHHKNLPLGGIQFNGFSKYKCVKNGFIRKKN